MIVNKIVIEISLQEDIYGPWFAIACPAKQISREVWHLNEVMDEIIEIIAQEILD